MATLFNLFIDVIMAKNIEIYIFLLVLLFLLVISSKQSIKSSKSINVLSRMMICIAFIIVADGLSALINGRVYNNSILLNYIFSVISLSTLETLSTLWIIYILYEIHSVYSENKLLKSLLFIPVFILFIILITAPINKLIFYINEKNEYVRGPLFLMHSFISYIYMVSAIIITAIQRRKEVLPDKKRNCTLLIIYGIIPFIGGAFQILMVGSNAMSLSLVMSTNMLYLTSINQEATLDPLTKLNNKLQFNSYLSEKTSKMKKNHLYLLFFDMNDFKSVNDNFGHHEGDKAIIQVADILKSIFSGTDSFCARNGGDEFAAVVETDDTNLEERINLVHEKLRDASKALPYTLSVSVGYAKYGDEDTKTIDDLIRKADENMYENKEKMKKTGVLTEQPV